MVPFFNTSKSDFFTLFDSYEVIPINYREDYLEKVENKEYFEAMGYCLSISKGQFNKLNNENNIEFVDNNIFINVKYDSELGLLLSDEEDNFI